MIVVRRPASTGCHSGRPTADADEWKVNWRPENATINPARSTEAFQCHNRHLKPAGNGHGLTDRLRDAETLQRPLRSPEYALDPDIGDGNDLSQRMGETEFDHASKELEGRLRQSAFRSWRVGGKVEREAAAFPDARILRDRLAIEELRKDIAQHCRASRRQKTHTAMEPVIHAAYKVNGIERIETIPFQSLLDLHVPIEPVTKDTAAQLEHV